MPKTIRPERVFADHEEDAIVVEYIIQKFDDSDCQTSFQKKQTKVFTKSIDGDTDISRLARKIVKQCKQIPPQWICQVEEALTEIQQRDDFDQEANDFVDPSEVVVSKLDRVLDMLYGDTDDKIAASLEVLSICNEVNNLHIITQHHQLVSALARIYSDQSMYSPELSFNIGKVFLSLSNFEEFHPILIKYQVGSTVMAIIEQETNRCVEVETNQSYRVGNELDNPRTKNRRHSCILHVCLSTLMRLSDNPEVLCKMMKKGLVDTITQTLANDNLPMYPMESALFMLHRASIFGETAEYSSNQDHPLIERLISSLSNTNECIVSSALSILYNLGFCKGCRRKMINSELSLSLTELFDNSIAMSLLYQVSIDPEQRRNIFSPKLLQAISLAVDSNKATIPLQLGAVLINLSCEPLWAEGMISNIDSLLDKVSSGDILMAKVVRNLAKWTHDLQHCIGLVYYSRDFHQLSLMTNDPQKFLQMNEDQGMDSADDPYTRYRDQNFWSTRTYNQISSIIQLYVKKDAGPLVLEMTGTLNHLTRFDLPSSDGRERIIDSIALMRRISMLDASNIVMKLEAIMLCSKLCENHDTASLVAESNIIHDMISIWEKCDGDAEVHLHILKLCEYLIKFEETRSTVLMGTDSMQYIFDSLGHENMRIRQTAIRCMDGLADNNGSKDDVDDRFSSIGQERRFLMYNRRWAESV